VSEIKREKQRQKKSERGGREEGGEKTERERGRQRRNRERETEHELNLSYDPTYSYTTSHIRRSLSTKEPLILGLFRVHECASCHIQSIVFICVRHVTHLNVLFKCDLVNTSYSNVTCACDAHIHEKALELMALLWLTHLNKTCACDMILIQMWQAQVLFKCDLCV